MRLLPRSRRGRVAVGVGLATVLLAAGWCREYRPWEAHCRGRPVSWWDRAFTRYSQEPVVFCGRWRPWWDRWLYPLGLSEPRDPLAEMVGGGPGVDFDPDAVPVLAALLGSADPNTRRLAIDILGAGGQAARPAAPDLVRTLGDHDG